jgi:hypothetical protein
MSDEEFIYRQDIKEKKATGRGAFHKKGGSKSKKCNFPSDYMTRKEKQALNGEVMSYNPNKFYSYAEFKQLPMEYQVKYVNSLMDKYQIGLSNISTILFGLSKSGLYAWFSKHDQLQYINTVKPSQGMSKLFAKNALKLKEDIEKALWPNRDEEIQNESFEVTLVGGGSEHSEEAPKELTIQEKIDQAAETVKLYESRGMEMKPELINQIYEEKTGMSFALAMEHTGKPIGKVEKVEESEDGVKIFANLTDEGLNVLSGNSKKPEDSTDDFKTKNFLITTNKLDDEILVMIHRLFDGRKYELTITVALEED